jgi:hypothetical protein
MLLAACSTVSPAYVPPTPVATEETPAAQTVDEDTQAEPGNLGFTAFVRDGTLYMRLYDDTLVQVEDCSAGNCFIYYPKWSPQRDRLLYYVGSYDGSVPHQIRVADLTGASQQVTGAAAYVQPATWSWDGSAIAFRTDTDRYVEVSNGPAQRVQELWTTDVAPDGSLTEPALRGELTFGEGCGGGGRSESANVYEREGGFAYGYLSGVLLWTPGDILLYSDNCTTRGISRFDMVNNVALDPLPGALRSLSLNHSGDAWVAIDEQNQIVTGTPESLEYEIVPASAPPEMVVFGNESGTIYYTTFEIVDSVDLIESASATLDPSVLIFPYFDVTNAQLFSLDPATGTEQLLYAADGYAYARMQETPNGLLFSRVEDNTELQTVVEEQTLTAENWRSYLPQVDVLLIPQVESSQGESEPVLYLADAEQFSLAQ